MLTFENTFDIMQIQTNVHEHIFTGCDQDVFMERKAMNRSVNEISGSHRRIRRITEMSEREYISFKKRRATALNIKNNMIKQLMNH